MKRPNILFALADDASHLGSHYNFVHTPNFDDVAHSGVLFENAFTTNPKCAPSRASILTGQHTWQLKEACTHWCNFPSGFDLYPDLLEKNGYHVGYTGKGWAPGNWKAFGLPRNPAGPEFNTYQLEPPKDSDIATCDYARNFEDFLSKKPADAPFCFWYGCREPHRSYRNGEGMRGGKDPDTVHIPSYLPDEAVVRSDFCDYAYEIDWFDLQLGKMLQILEERGERENTLIVVTSDNGAPFPRIKGQMYEQDFNLPLAISWPDKVKGKRRVKDIVSFIDFAPTFLEIAGVPIPSRYAGKSLTDILYSQKDGIVNPERKRAFMGRERHDLGRQDDKGYPVRCIRTPTFLYVRNFEPQRYPAGNPETWYTNCDNSPTKRCILHQHAEGDNYYYNLAFGLRPMEELYQIVDDPECMHNLADKHDYRDIKGALWSELQHELRITEDPRIFGNGDIFDSYEYVKDPRHSWAHFLKGDWVKLG